MCIYKLLIGAPTSPSRATPRLLNSPHLINELNFKLYNFKSSYFNLSSTKARLRLSQTSVLFEFYLHKFEDIVYFLNYNLFFIFYKKTYNNY